MIIGLDALDPDFLERHRDNLPVLKGLMDEGVSGKLRSTIPPFSFTAWTSAMCGMNPGRTGITGLPKENFQWTIPPLNSQSVKTPRIWDVAGMNEKKVGVINVPLTYPPFPVNGFMISGFLNPNSETNYGSSFI